MAIRIRKRPDGSSGSEEKSVSRTVAAEPAPQRVVRKKTGSSGVMQAKSVPPKIPNPPELLPAHVHGTYFETVKVIPRTLASLHLMPGQLGDDSDETNRTALLPLAEVRLGSAPLSGDSENDDESATLITANLPLENLAYVLLDLTSDLKRICSDICDMGEGRVVVDPARMAHVRFYLAHLERQARLARVRLDRRYGAPEADEE